ncbi:preprotein translocase subunit SecE [Pseudobutyrivibrio sp. YE44]|uniref:preprotein translocase subunit SecE n=1 Tax=Pseudobutyrivibrio sp. YE44 TaxID=1520802 RepID=UPI000885D452|nr:preprotein translocase subunit SecE [Pseudobutyrivibrio sp. YE44]SDB30197.1 preprotein translocase subunit SecE [Pseudobutyrivibrio sp. YE44]
MTEEKKTKSGRLAGLKSEFNKIVWADPTDVSKQTTAVVAVSVVVAVIIIVLDAVINKGVNILVNL